ncbi:hypothetical protein [Jannaschia formosa]|nr:hypothetical protein [Jannaschia formosa]
MRLILPLLLVPSLASATPVIVPVIQGLPVAEPAAPAPEPCTPEPCDARL